MSSSYRDAPKEYSRGTEWNSRRDSRDDRYTGKEERYNREERRDDRSRDNDRRGGGSRDYDRGREHDRGREVGGRDYDRYRDAREYRRMLENKSKTSIYVGNLTDDIREEELDDMFYKYGRIRDIDIKRGRSGNGKAYAFIEFESIRVAEDAVDRCDGRSFGDSGSRLRVELTGDRRPRYRDGGSFGGKYGGRRTNTAPQRTCYRVIVTNLPSGCRWQHLKDHMRKAGEVGFANVEQGRGVVEYATEEDMKYAVEKLDSTEMEAAYNVRAIRVRLDDGSRDDARRSRSRSRSRGSRESRGGGRSRSFSAGEKRDRRDNRSLGSRSAKRARRNSDEEGSREGRRLSGEVGKKEERRPRSSSRSPSQRSRSSENAAQCKEKYDEDQELKTSARPEQDDEGNEEPSFVAEHAQEDEEKTESPPKDE